jgi:hypothetical protein
MTNMPALRANALTRYMWVTLPGSAAGGVGQAAKCIVAKRMSLVGQHKRRRAWPIMAEAYLGIAHGTGNANVSLLGKIGNCQMAVASCHLANAAMRKFRKTSKVMNDLGIKCMNMPISSQFSRYATKKIIWHEFCYIGGAGHGVWQARGCDVNGPRCNL